MILGKHKLNIENVKRTIELLKTIPDEKFDMCYYREGDETTHECDSIGCILGHATVLDTMENIGRYMSVRNGNINFRGWSEHFFGISSYSKEWEYMFSVKWGDSMKTLWKDHAIYRLTKIVEGYKPEAMHKEFNWELHIIKISDGDYQGYWEKEKQEYLKQTYPVWK